MTKSVVLTGFMGSGKTTVGKIAAKKLSWPFIDADHEIEQEFGMPATEIFKTLGEAVFRQEEKSLITKLSAKESTVISLGGGAFLQREIRDVCMANCTVVYLDISWEAWKNRMPFLISTRPVLQGLTVSQMEELYYKRIEFYTYYHFRISMDSLDAEEAGNKIAALIRK
ncbi:shikimate kinase [Neobacillus terrae]|uniref:shikimate kinase n=1 Tax=Neobacillus terrae TaxID=3034837 RepID=UPI00140C5477|nr:shikimate kinase [Neobacillus terrae]NHM33954.1 shikimate kinase [Neobacillus terrae]